MINGYAQVRLKTTTLMSIMQSTIQIDALTTLDEEELESLKGAVLTRKPLFISAIDGDGYLFMGACFDTGDDLRYFAQPLMFDYDSDVLLAIKYIICSNDFSSISINTHISQ